MSGAETVHGDPYTLLFHVAGRYAGADSISMSRPQAARLGYDPCRDCYSSRGDGPGQEVPR